MAVIALLDACVLYPAPLRDLLMHLAIEGLFHARWSRRIQDEWTRALLRSKPHLANRLKRTRRLMEEAILDSVVEGWEEIEPLLALPDPGDRHVLAAAIACRADVIVTWNLKHFPTETLRANGVSAMHPDAFIRQTLGADVELALFAVRELRVGLRAPPQSADQYLATLLRQGLPDTVAFLRPRAGLI